MKKFYSLTFLLIVSVLCFTAKAITITFNVDNPDYVTLEISYVEQALKAGDNTFEFTNNWQSISVTGKNQGKVTVTDPDGNKLSSPFYPKQEYDGKTITITTQAPEEYRTASVKLTVDKASAVTVAVGKTKSEVSYKPELTNGENTIYYEPEVDKNIRIYSSVSAQVPLYSVTVANGTSEPVQSGNVYDIALPCDGDIVVKSQFPDIDLNVSFEYGEGMDGFVSKVTRDAANGEEVNTGDGTFSVKAGTILYIHGDTEKYLLTSYKVDDFEVKFSTPQRLIVTDKDVKVSFEGRKYETFDVTVSINDPEAVNAYYGSNMTRGDKIDLIAGNNTVTMTENNPSLLFEPADNSQYKIESATYNGTALEPNYAGKIQVSDLKANDKVEIVTAAIVRDLNAVIYLDNETNYNLTLTNSFGTEIPLKEGYNHIKFCAEDNNFKFTPPAFNYDTRYIYANDDEVEKSGWGTSAGYSFSIAEGSVVKVFVGSEAAPEWCELTFAENGFADVDVIADEIRPVTDRAGFETLAGTKIEITPKEGKGINGVTVDGDPVTADSEGKYVFTVTGKHNIAFSSSSSIDEINAASTDRVIYNLQGMRITTDADNLPAGIYIINGKKVMVK